MSEKIWVLDRTHAWKNTKEEFYRAKAVFDELVASYNRQHYDVQVVITTDEDHIVTGYEGRIHQTTSDGLRLGTVDIIQLSLIPLMSEED